MNNYANESLKMMFGKTPKRQNYVQVVGQFTLKFADTLEELTQVFKLRYSVFWGESDEDRWDVDLFDLAADHLIIVDNLNQKVVGTYRLINSNETQTFYSQTEFSMDSILQLEGSKVECGRACIHKDYRNGSTIALLWQGLGDYIINNNIRWMFGCSSIKASSSEHQSMIHHYLMKNHLVTDSLISQPELPASIELTEEHSNSRLAERTLPPLLRTYLKIGAKVCGHPHLDEEMNCIDYLTLLDTQVLHKEFEKRFCGNTP